MVFGGRECGRGGLIILFRVVFVVFVVFVVVLESVEDLADFFPTELQTIDPETENGGRPPALTSPENLGSTVPCAPLEAGIRRVFDAGKEEADRFAGDGCFEDVL